MFRLMFFMAVLHLSCTKVEPRRPIKHSTSNRLFKKTVEESKRLNKIEETKIIELIKRDSNRKYFLSPSGFWYTYIKKIDADLPFPKAGDLVEIVYDIRDLKDSIIYSKETLGLKKYKVDNEDFIPGLQVGIKLMKKGETINFVIPSYNAFGIAGDGKRIGINQSIKSTLSLINIK